MGPSHHKNTEGHARSKLNSELSQKRFDHKLVALVSDPDALLALTAEREDVGLDVEEVLVLHGPAGIERFNFDGSHHGWWAHLRRAIKNVGGADANILTMYREGLEDGQLLLFVPVREREARDRAVTVLRHHHAHAMSFFTRGSMESIPSLESRVRADFRPKKVD